MPETPVVTQTVTPEGTPQGTPAVQTPWTDALPEAYRGDPNITKYASMEDFAKGHVNLAGMVGKRLDLANPDTRKMLGVPETADGYAYDIPADLQTVLSPEAAKALSPLFLDAGLTAAQAKALTPKLAAHLQGAQKAWQDQTVAEHAAWKAKDPLHYAEQVALASGILNPDTALGKQLDPDGSTKALLESLAISEKPAMQQFLARVAALCAEQPHVETGAPRGGLSAGTLDQQIDNIQKNVEFLSGKHVNQRQMQQELQRLLQARYPQTQ